MHMVVVSSLSRQSAANFSGVIYGNIPSSLVTYTRRKLREDNFNSQHARIQRFFVQECSSGSCQLIMLLSPRCIRAYIFVPDYVNGIMAVPIVRRCKCMYLN